MDEYEYESDDPEVKEVEENIKWHLTNADNPKLHAYLRAQGKDPAEVIAFYREMDVEFRAVKRECSRIMETVEERELQAMANAADAELAAYKSLVQFYHTTKKMMPFHPELPAMEAQLEEMRKRVPKDID